jgi:hypothetical protein
LGPKDANRDRQLGGARLAGWKVGMEARTFLEIERSEPWKVVEEGERV